MAASLPPSALGFYIIKHRYQSILCKRHPKGAGFKWDAEAERDLFGACLVVLCEPKGKTLADAHQLLVDTRGVTYTPNAAHH